MDIHLVQRIVDEVSGMSPTGVLHNLGFLSLAVASRFLVGKFKFGKKLAAVRIARTTSRVRPVLNAFAGPLTQAPIAALSAMDGHLLVPLLLGFAVGLDLIVGGARVGRYRNQALIYEKGLVHCGELLPFEKAEECYFEGNELFYRRKNRVVVLSLDHRVKSRLSGTLGWLDRSETPPS